MGAYSVQKDLPPAPAQGRVSAVPTVSSAYSDDYANTNPGNNACGVTAGNKDSYHPSYHAHPQQQVKDHGPQIRQSRLPLFKQVRSMLHKPPPLTTPGNAKWDEYTGELSDDGKASHVKPSTYETAFKASRKRSPDRPAKSRRNQSPVSVLRDDEAHARPPLEASRHSIEDISPVSPVSVVSPVPTAIHGSGSDDAFEFVPEMMPDPLSPNIQRLPQLPQTPASSTQIKRKPVSRAVSTIENIPPTSPHQRSSSETSDPDPGLIDNRGSSDQRHPNSHFSWTTYAPSVAPGRQSTDTYAPSVAQGRPSMDTMASRQSKNPAHYSSANEPKKSHFSWSTVNTTVTNRARPESPPSPPPPVPTKYSGHPVQSILSRQRPIKRLEKEEWTPPPRKSSRPEGTTTPRGYTTPTSATSARPLPLPKDRTTTPISYMRASPTTTPSSGKALPPPPRSVNLTHLESLLAQEQSLALQRRNVEKGLSELEKIETASPLEVPFATVRDAKKKLEEYRKRLAEVMLEEREVGIAVTRARRKEEEENGWEGATLWVRRVTS
ncbi:uncharacterized protein LTR77_005790 [Saxophila tyrrhenica]|uniref:Uncharacterized protein n=1 Tax=Saxophila tyrrhenica TaxID=1690608 RepID=A0AAV9PA37_9PEZI|nr:hypothetical protein LTR77_005790 [Saxophila tyrrhenica]